MDEPAERERYAIPLHWELLFYPVPFALALVLRIAQLAVFVTQGELAWTYRAATFWQAVSRRTVDASTLADPSGTVMLWLSWLGLALRRAVVVPGVVLGWDEFARLSAYDPQSPADLRLLASFWPVTVLAVVIAGSVLTVLIAVLAARLWGARAGLFAGLLVAAAPCHLALSRTLSPDSLTAGLALSSLLALLWAVREWRPWAPFILAGLLGGLAILNQGTAAILAPYSLFLLLAGYLARWRSPLLWLRNLALWLGALLVACLVVYPGTWVAPLPAAQTLAAYAAGALRRFATPAPAAGTALWLGLRLTPLSLAGLALAIPRLPLDDNRHRLPVLALLGFALALPMLASTQGGQDASGALTAIIALDVVAAVGLDGVATGAARLAGRRSRRLALGVSLALSAALLALVGWQTSRVVEFRPYYPAYRNPWLAARAPAQDRAGRGEGMDRVAAYLNAQPEAERLCVATPDMTLLAPLFVGDVVPLTEKTLNTADFIALYNRDWLGSSPLLAHLPKEPPDQVVRLHGTEYARIYANRAHEPVVDLIAGEARLEDIVILDAPSPFPREYDGLAPYEEIQVSTPAQVAGTLNELASGRWRLWHVAFEEGDPQQVVRSLLESQAMLLERHELPGAVVSLYLLPLRARFDPLVPNQEIGLEFGPGLALERAGLAASQVQYRQRIALALQWRSLTELEGNVSLSLRLVDSRGRLWAKRDGWIMDGAGRPTAVWAAGEAAESLHTLQVPPGAPPGPYHLRVVVYMADSLKALAPVDSTGVRLSTEIDLLPLEILPAQAPPDVETFAFQHPLEFPLTDGIQVLACEIDRQSVASGQDLPLRVWWRAAHPMTVTYQAHLMLLDGQGDLRGDAVVDLAGPDHPTSDWIQDEIIEGRYRLPVSPEAAPGEGIVGVELLSPLDDVAEPLRLGTVQVAAIERVFQPPPIDNPRQETLGELVRLLGYDLEPATARPGQTLRLTLYWQDLAPMPTSYTVFTHLLYPNGQLYTGHDGTPANGSRPTSGWVLHEVVTDAHEIEVPADAQPGQYLLEVGLYERESGSRLPAYDVAGARLEYDRILLGGIEVVGG